MARRKTPAATWDEFFKVLSTTANVRKSAAAAGISSRTAYRRRARDPDFAERWEEAIGDSGGSTEPNPDEKTPRKNVHLGAGNGAVAGGENPVGSGGAAAGGLVGKRRDAGPKRWQARFSKWLAERHHKGGKVAAPSAADVHALKLTLERIETKLLGSIQEERQAHTEELGNYDKGERKGALPLPPPAQYVRGGLRSKTAGLGNSLRAVVKRMRKRRRRPKRWLGGSNAGGLR